MIKNHKRSFARIMVPIEILEEKLPCSPVWLLGPWARPWWGNRSRKTTDIPFHNMNGDEYSHPPSCFVSGWITWTKHNKTKPCYRFCLKNNMNSLHKSMLFHPATIPAHFSIPWQAIIPRSSRRAFHRCEAGMWNFATKGSLSLPEPWVQDTGLEPKDFWALP